MGYIEDLMSSDKLAEVYKYWQPANFGRGDGMIDQFGESGGVDLADRAEIQQFLAEQRRNNGAAGSDGSGLSGFGGLLPLLDDNQQLDSLGPLFRTLLALQGGGGKGGNDLFGLFSGIQL